MKKNIAIIILVVTNLVSIVYAFAQATIANHAMEEAVTQRELAEETMEIAQEAEMKAHLEAERARIAEDSAIVALKRAKEAIEKCK